MLTPGRALPKPQRRRKQAERRAESRCRLLDAAAECLCERGYGATTVVEVARRAQLSTGCLQNHFPTKQDLMAAAVEHVFEQHRARLVDALGSLPDAPDRILRALDLLWAAMQGDAFVAYLELVVAARTDPALGPHVERTANHLSDQTEATFRSLYTPPLLAQPFADVMPTLIFGVLEGARLGEIASPGRGDAARALAALKQMHLLVLEASERVAPKAPKKPARRRVAPRRKRAR